MSTSPAEILPLLPLPPHGQIVWLPHGDVVPSPLNPRKYFDPSKIEELKTSFRAHGFRPSMSTLLVRPLPQSPAAGNEAVTSDTLNHPDGSKYELVCGERRWRASGELIADGAMKPLVPVVIETLDDVEVAEMRLIENLQREDLTSLEEAEGYRETLEMRDAAGRPAHTAKTLAARIGRSEMHIRHRLSLCRLRGTATGEALESGELPLSHAYLLARVPAGALRDDLTRRVLRPPDGFGPMPHRQLERVIREECMVELRGANFSQLDPTLVPLVLDPVTGERTMGGTCPDCPFNTRNHAPEAAKELPAKLHMCMHPECYRAKTAVAHDRWAAEVTDEVSGRRGLPADQAGALWDYSGKKLNWQSGYVELDARPHESDPDLRRGAHPGTWAQIIRGQGVPVVLARDTAGRVHELVRRDLAVAAGRQAERDRPPADQVFRATVKAASPATSAGASAPAAATPEEQAPGQRYSAEAAQLKTAQLQAERLREERFLDAETAAVVEGAQRNPAGMPLGMWEMLFRFVAEQVDEMGDPPSVIQRRGWKLTEDDEDNVSAFFCRQALAMTDRERSGFLAELLLAGTYVYDRRQAVEQAARAFSVDLKPVRQKVEAELAADAMKTVPAKRLGLRIIDALEAAGTDGMTVKAIAEQIGETGPKVYAWFGGPACKGVDRLRKIGPAKYQMLPAEVEAPAKLVKPVAAKKGKGGQG